MVRTSQRRISLSSIDLRDEAFRISFGRPIAALRKSIHAVGLLNPPVVRESKPKGCFQVVLGFRRVEACRALRHKEILCRVLATGYTEREVLLMSVHDAVASESLNPIEIARALKRLGEFVEYRELIEAYLPLFGLGRSGEVLMRYVQLLRLSRSLQLAVAREQLAVGVAGELLRVLPAERRALFGLFRQLRLGVNLQKEFFTLCFEISRRDTMSITQLIQDSGVQEILNDERLSASQKAEHVREHLKQLRFPRLSEKERRFHSAVKRLGLPPGAALYAPPYFEGTTYRLELRFGTCAELREKVGQLKERLEERLEEGDFE
jgi:hypothetical protein